MNSFHEGDVYPVDVSSSLSTSRFHTLFPVLNYIYLTSLTFPV